MEERIYKDKEWQTLRQLIEFRQNPVFDEKDLLKVEEKFHELILERSKHLWTFEECQKKYPWFILPKISNDLSGEAEPSWLTVPEFYGGFSYCLVEEYGKPVIFAESWCRICGGSEQLHKITIDDIILLEKGLD